MVSENRVVIVCVCASVYIVLTNTVNATARVIQSRNSAVEIAGERLYMYV